MKKLLTLAALLVLCAVCAFAIAEKDGDYTYTVNSDNTVTITGFDWESNGARDIYVPEMLGNRMVTAIGDKAFMTTGNSAVSITLPDGIKSIGEQAFRGVAIKYINIPLSTKEIGSGAFAQCSVMQFRVASGHDTFATIENALYNKQTKTLICWPENKEIGEIPDGIVGIGDYVFYARESGVTIPESLKYIGKYAFANSRWSGGSEFDFKSIEIIDDYAFYNRSQLKAKDLSHIKQIGDYAFGNILDLRISNGMIGAKGVKIGAYAFSESVISNENYGSTKFTINDKAEIGDFAFAETTFGSVEYGRIYYTSSRKYIDASFLNSVESIGREAFRGTAAHSYDDKLKNDVYEINVNIIPDKAFYMLNYKHFSDFKAFEAQCWFPRHLKLGSNVVEIGNNAFGNERIEDIELSEGLLTIKDKAFYGCTELKKINIPSTVTFIGSQVFDGCSDTLVITVEKDSYGEVWARTCGYSYVINGEDEDTSWLTSEDTSGLPSWLN